MDSNQSNGDVYLKLISGDGMEFFMEKNIAMSGSRTIKAMLEGNFRESENNEIRFPDIDGAILEKVIQYFHYKKENATSKGQIPEFQIEPEIALELLQVANYLEC